MDPLIFLAERQSMWSQTATRLKNQIDLARNFQLTLTVFGAISAAVASNLPNEGTRVVFAVASAICLALVSFIAARYSSTDVRQRHIRARMASEALKREAYVYSTGTGEYTVAESRSEILHEKISKIDSACADLMNYAEISSPQKTRVFGSLNLSAYLAERINDQLNYYKDSANKLAVTTKRFQFAEVSLAFVAAIMAAAAGVLGKAAPDLATIVGVLTTLTAALVAHQSVARNSELLASRRATQLALQSLKSRVNEHYPLEKLVAETEQIIGAETKSWQLTLQK